MKPTQENLGDAVNSDYNQFLEMVDFQKDLCKQLDHTTTLKRGQQKICSLCYDLSHPKFIRIVNLGQYCKFIKRNIKSVAKYFAAHLGVHYEVINQRVQLKGTSTLQKLREIEKSYYEKKLLCQYCESPDTTENEEGIVSCLSCGKT